MKKKLCFALLCAFLLLLSGIALVHAGGSSDYSKGIITNPQEDDDSDEIALNEIALLAGEGDLLGIGGIVYFRYRHQDGRRLVIRIDSEAPYKVFLNDQLIALIFDHDPDVWEWLRKCDAREFRHLRAIYWDAAEADFSLLKRIAKARPDLGLYVGFSEDSLPLARQVISLFTPSWLVLTGGEAIDEQLLPALNRLELLFLISAENLSFIDRLPRLNALITGEDVKDIDAARLPGRLRSLTLIRSNIENPAALDHLKKLRNLHLVGCKVKDADSFPVLPKLREAGFAGCEDLANASVLLKLSSLEWIAFPQSTSQEEFNHCIQANPRLQVVAIPECKNLHDLSALEHLPKLKGLVVQGLPLEDMAAVPKLQHLELVLVGVDDADEEEIQQYQRAFPDVQVLPGGYCLGSGWILLVVPLVAALSLAAHRRKKGSGG
jgi:hypothetical protein